MIAIIIRATAPMLSAIATMSSSESSSSLIERASAAHTKIFLAYALVAVGSAIITALFMYLAWKSGNKVQDAIRADGEARIAQLKADSEDAKRNADRQMAGAQKEIASLNKQAEALKLETESVRKEVVAGKAETARANEGAAKANVEAAKANERAEALELATARQREKAAVAEKALLELQRRLTPRQLAANQFTTLVEALKRAPVKGPVDVVCVNGDSEGAAFAAQLNEALKAAGWPTAEGVSQATFISKYPIGLTLRVHSIKAPPPSALALQQAFEVVELSILGEADTRLGEDRLEIMVGTKPP